MDEQKYLAKKDTRIFLTLLFLFKNILLPKENILCICNDDETGRKGYRYIEEMLNKKYIAVQKFPNQEGKTGIRCSIELYFLTNKGLRYLIELAEQVGAYDPSGSLYTPWLKNILPEEGTAYYPIGYYTDRGNNRIAKKVKKESQYISFYGTSIANMLTAYAGGDTLLNPHHTQLVNVRRCDDEYEDTALIDGDDPQYVALIYRAAVETDPRLLNRRMTGYNRETDFEELGIRSSEYYRFIPKREFLKKIAGHKDYRYVVEKDNNKCRFAGVLDSKKRVMTVYASYRLKFNLDGPAIVTETGNLSKWVNSHTICENDEDKGPRENNAVHIIKNERHLAGLYRDMKEQVYKRALTIGNIYFIKNSCGGAWTLRKLMLSTDGELLDDALNSLQEKYPDEVEISSRSFQTMFPLRIRGISVFLGEIMELKRLMLLEEELDRRMKKGETQFGIFCRVYQRSFYESLFPDVTLTFF